MGDNFFFELNQWYLLAAGIAAFLACAEIGFRAGRRRVAVRERAAPHVATIEGAMLGLLALLLGFAFSMAMGRYEERKVTLLDEANDIGTAYLRAQLLPAVTRGETKRLLREYVDSRIALYKAPLNSVEAKSAIALSSALQAKLWAQVVTAVEYSKDEVTSGYFVEALNSVIDDHTRRVTALENHLPGVIFSLLLFVAAMTMALSGYSSGLDQIRLPIPRIILVVLVATTLMVIADLDRPRRGLIQVSMKSLIDLQQSLALGDSEVVSVGK